MDQMPLARVRHVSRPGFHHVASIGLIVLLGVGLVACASNPSIGDDGAGIIERVEWVEYAEIADEIGRDHSDRVLPSSTPTRIVIALWQGTGRPGIRVSSAGSAERLAITVEATDPMTGDLLKPWPIAVVTRTAVDPSTVVLRVVETN